MSPNKHLWNTWTALNALVITGWLAAWQQEMAMATWNATSAQELGRFCVTKISLEKSNTGRSSSKTWNRALQKCGWIWSTLGILGIPTISAGSWNTKHQNIQCSIVTIVYAEMSLLIFILFLPSHFSCNPVLHLAAKLLQCCQNIQIDLRCNCWTLQVELLGMDPSKWSLVPNLITGCGRLTHAQTVKSEAKNTWACDLCSYNVDSWPRLCNKHSYCINQNVLISWQVWSAQWGSHSDWSYTVPHTTLSKPEGMELGIVWCSVSPGFIRFLLNSIKDYQSHPISPAGTWWDMVGPTLD